MTVGDISDMWKDLESFGIEFVDGIMPPYETKKKAGPPAATSIPSTPILAPLVISPISQGKNTNGATEMTCGGGEANETSSSHAGEASSTNGGFGTSNSEEAANGEDSEQAEKHASDGHTPAKANGHQPSGSHYGHALQMEATAKQAFGSPVISNGVCLT